MTEIPELTEEQFARAIPASVRKRLMLGKFESGDDIAALRRALSDSPRRSLLSLWASAFTLSGTGSRVGGTPRVPQSPCCASPLGIRGSSGR
jgi:hypothetical protein